MKNVTFLVHIHEVNGTPTHGSANQMKVGCLVAIDNEFPGTSGAGLGSQPIRLVSKVAGVQILLIFSKVRFLVKNKGKYTLIFYLHNESN